MIYRYNYKNVNFNSNEIFESSKTQNFIAAKLNGFTVLSTIETYYLYFIIKTV